MILLNLRLLNPRLQFHQVARVILASLAVAMLCIAWPRVSAQEAPTTGSIRGTVRDANGAVLAGAKVSITSKATGHVVNVTSSPAGEFTSSELTAGEYLVRIEYTGVRPWEATMTVQAGVVAGADTTLGIAKSLVNTNQAALQSVLSAPYLEDLPINGRNFLELGQLAPGVQIHDGGDLDPKKSGLSVISFNGDLGRTSLIEADGLDITDEIVGSVTQNIPQEAIQEFRMQQSMLDLSTDVTSSGAVNVITRSGANAFHGQGHYYFRDQELDANLPGAWDKTFQRSEFGARFGGALIKDKLFFFLDAERTQQNFLSPVLPEAPFQSLAGSFNAPLRELEGVGRLDWKIRDNAKVFYRFSFDQNSNVSTLAPSSFQPFANYLHTSDQALGLDFTTGRYTHSLRFGYLWMSDQLNSAVNGNVYDPLPGIELAIGSDPYCMGFSTDAFCSGQPFYAPQASYQSDLQFKYDGGRIMGQHTFHYGAALNRIQGGGFDRGLSLGPLVNSPVVPGGSSDPLLYAATNVELFDGQSFATEKSAFGFPGGGLGPDNRLSFYLGDSFKLRSNLTVTYGVRYEHESGRTDSDLGLVQALNQFGAGLGDRVRNPEMNFAPQLGVAWDPLHSGKTVIRAGGGLFYDNAPWNQLLFDRAGRLPQGDFRATQPLCTNGAPINFILPGTSTAVDASGICGQPIGNIAAQIMQIQQQYEAAWSAAAATANPAYVGNALADGIGATGTSLLNPNYRTPRSVQMNVGIEHQFAHNTVFSLDYVRNISTHTLLALDTNHVGDANYLNTNAALAAINTTVASVGCGPATGPGASAENAVNCYLAAVPTATIANFAVNGLDSADELCGGRPCASLSTPGNPHAAAAFPGINPNAGTNQMLSPIGHSRYQALQLALQQEVRNPFKDVLALHMQFSYTFSRYDSTEQNTGLVSNATDYNNTLFFFGPNALDRTQQISFGGTIDLPRSFHLGLISHFASPLPQTLTLPSSGTPGGIFMTDWTGDGSGDGTLVSNGTGLGDILPGTNVGSYGRTVKPDGLSQAISVYNTNFSGKLTPAGTALVNADLFTQAQLSLLGGVMPVVAPAPVTQATMPWLRSLDLNLTWVYKVKDKVEIQPGVSFFNVMNLSNFDSPNNLLSGVLTGAPGSLNGTPGNQPNNLRVGAGSGAFALGSPRVIEFGLKIAF